jgi:hypothetical protein
MRRSLILCAVVLLMAAVLSGCHTTMTQGPTTWLDQPLDGAKLALEPQEITAHASDDDGVASFDFYVDGTLLISVPMRGDAIQFGRPATSGATLSGVSSGAAAYLADTTVGWNPSAPGVYTISARATDSQGNIGPEAVAVVTVGELEGSPTPLPTVRPTEEIVTQETPSPQPPSPSPATGTPIPPTREPTSIPPTRQPTSIPPTRTPLPPSPTPTVPPRAPHIAYFEANPSIINEGGCSTLSWGVEYATEVYLEGQGVRDHGTQQVCPPRTTSYTLVARSPAPGGEDTRSVTVTVREPSPTPTITPSPIVTFEVPDFEAPYVSNLNADPTSIPANIFPCTGGQTTVSVFADDPSGVAGVVAHWTLGSQSGQVNMAPQGGGVYRAVLGPFGDTGNLEIRFVARDTVGNSNDPPVGPITVLVHSIC